MEEAYEDKIVENYKKSKENPLKNLLSRVTVVHILFGGILLLIAYSLIKKSTDPKVNYIIYGSFIIIILFLLFKPSKEKKLLPDYKAKEIAQAALDRKVREGKEFAFDSKIFVTPYCHLVYENDMTTGFSGPIKWDIGFVENVSGTQYKKYGVISIHCYEGVVTGIDHRPFGFTGRESRDRDIIPVGVVQGNVKTSDFGQPKTG